MTTHRTILIVNTLYPPSQVGGAEKSVSLLAEALARAGNTVVCVCLTDAPARIDEVRNGVTVVRLPLDNIYWPYSGDAKPAGARRILWHLIDMWNVRAARRFAPLLDEFKPDVVHTNNLTGFSVAVWHEIRKRGIPIVHTLRDYSLACGRSALFRDNRLCETRCLDCKALTTIRQWKSTEVDKVASNSAYVIAEHDRHGFFKGKPSAVIYNIADLAAKPTRANTPDDTLVFGFIGRVEEEKGIEVVLEATRAMKTSNWRLAIAGRGIPDYVDGLKAEYDDPRIEWLGFASPDTFYSSIDTSLIASVWPEPLPRTLIESFAYGRSAICARSGGIPEIAAQGKCVAEYDAFDVQALAGLMDAAVRDAGRWKEAHTPDPDFFSAFSEREIVGRYTDLYFKS